MKLYHYTSIDSFTKIWVSQQLRFSEAKNLNDIFEKQKTFSLSGDIIHCEEQVTLMNAIDKFKKILYGILREYKQISFSLDTKREKGYLSPMMWGQYAHNENGVCIEIDYDKLTIPRNVFRSKVKYTYELKRLDFSENIFLSGDYVDQYIHQNRGNIFFTKHKHWQHENEYRMVAKSIDFLSIESAISHIYVYGKDNINTQVIEALVNGKVDIDYLYLSAINGFNHLYNRSLKKARDFDKLMQEEPDYYSNPEKVKKRLESKMREFGLIK